MNVEPTVSIICHAAEILRGFADDLDRQADHLSATQDFTYAAEAAQTIGNIMQNLRIDLLVTRPIREYERQKILSGKENE